MKKQPSSANNSLFERLKILKECPLCDHVYEANKIVLLEEYGGSHFSHITCPKCKSAILHVVIVTQLGASAMGILTDLSAIEAVNLKRKPKISEDDLLGFHKYIFGKDNNFTKLILKYN